ncbi:MAG: PhnE/PtxC family ABC transporter permease [Actinomycetota bacterium]
MSSALGVAEREAVVAPAAKRRRRLFGSLTPRRTWGLLAPAAVAASALSLVIGRPELFNPAGWPMVREFLAAAFSPELSSQFLRITWDSALTTVAYAALGTAVSVVIGLIVGVVVSQTWWGIDSGGSRSRGRKWRRSGWLASRGALGLPRGVHEVVWGLFLVNILGLDPLVGVLAIGIPFGVVTAKVFSELLDEAPKQAYRALRSSGVRRLQAFAYALAPPAFPDLLSYSFYRFECAIRAAAILGIIGAGGLGYQLSLSFSSLRYAEMWTLIYALIIVCGLADLWSTTLRRPDRRRFLVTGGPTLRMRRDRLLNLSLASFVALALISWLHLELDPATLWSSRAQELFGSIAAASFPLNLTGEQVARLGALALQTVAMSVVAIAVASVLGVLTAFVAARSQGELAPRRQPARRLAGLGTRGMLLFCRAVPPPVWALLLLFFMLAGPLPGALALGLYNFGILGRLMAEVVENLDPQPVRALRAQGVWGVKAFAYGVLPLTLPRFAGFSVYRWEVTMREVVVVGLVAAGGLGRLLQEQLSAFNYPGLLATLLTLVGLTIFADLVGSSIRRALG